MLNGHFELMLFTVSVRLYYLFFFICKQFCYLKKKKSGPRKTNSLENEDFIKRKLLLRLTVCSKTIMMNATQKEKTPEGLLNTRRVLERVKCMKEWLLR